MKALFEYFDYQEFLRDHYESKKRASPYFSYRYLGGRLNLDPGFLLKVIQGRHHLAEKSLPALHAYFKFSRAEAAYFDALVRYNKSKTPAEIKSRFEDLVLLRDSRARPIEESQYAFFQKWYHSALHALLSIHPFKAGYGKLASLLNPPITAAQAKESLQLLVRLGMVRRNADGVFEPVDSFVSSGAKWRSAAVREYQRETILRAAEALERTPKELRDISTLTLALSTLDLPEIRERIRQLRQAILAAENEHPADAVYQINIQVYPVTKRIGGPA